MKKEIKKAQKKDTEIFQFVHPISGDLFTYSNTDHKYTLNGIELPGTTTPLKLVNELSWDAKGKMSDKTEIIKNWAIKVVVEESISRIKDYFNNCTVGSLIGEFRNAEFTEVEKIILEAKKKPNQHFKSAGLSGTEIHDLCEEFIKHCIQNFDGYAQTSFTSQHQQVTNFIKWSLDHKVKFLFSEEPIYSKEWMNCGTVDFICEINNKILIGDIKTNGDKRRFDWITGLPVSDIHTPNLWQAGAYGKMATEDSARKLIDKFDGVVVVNIKKGGEFDEGLDVRFDYSVQSLVNAYGHVIELYKEFRNKK